MNQNSKEVTINKGSRIRAQRMKAKLVPLAGAQMKFEGTWQEISGIVRHVRGDHPTNPTERWIFIDADPDYTGPTMRPPGCTCEKEHVQINPAHIVEVTG